MVKVCCDFAWLESHSTCFMWIPIGVQQTKSQYQLLLCTGVLKLNFSGDKDLVPNIALAPEQMRCIQMLILAS